VKQPKHKKLMLVRYGKMGYLGWFEHKETYIPKTKNRVVIKTDRGLELGELVGQFNYRSGQFKSTPDQVQEYFGKAQKDYPLTDGGTFVRFATDEDLMEEKHLDASAKEEMRCCQRFVNEMELPMKIVDAEHVFGGERIVIYFTSSGRVDFRELVKRLAREYQTRIELRQIGARDEARIVSDYESCGLPCCCRQFGRLKCCLRYEDATYKELKKRMPKKNTMVRTSQGTGKVVDMQILTQLVVVQDEAGEKKAFNLDEIEIISDKSVEKEAAEPVSPEPPEDENGPDEYAEDAESAGQTEKNYTKVTKQNKKKVGPKPRRQNNKNQKRTTDKD